MIQGFWLPVLFFCIAALLLSLVESECASVSGSQWYNGSDFFCNMAEGEKRGWVVLRPSSRKVR